MITKNYKSIFSYVAALTVGFFMVSCDQEDDTGYSTLMPNSTSLGITVEVSDITLIEDNSVYEFTASISDVQLVDVKLYAFQAGGDATLGDDFTLDQTLVIPAGAKSVTGEIKIIQDDIFEETETANIQIGNNKTANAAQASATMKFTILNYEDGDLDIQLAWGMSETTTDNSGEEIDPTDFADMRLLVSTTPDNQNVVLESDGGSFEHLVLPSTMDDGEYYVVSDFWSANEDIIRDINLNSTYNQIGVITDNEENFGNALSNASICSNNFFVLTKIMKTGDNFSITREGINNFENQVVTYSGTDADYPSEVATGVDCTADVITGVNAAWMLDFWGEIVIEEGAVYWTVDSSGIVTIENQFLYTTTWNGGVQPDYYIEGTGTYNDATGELTLKYSLIQDGWYLGEDYGEADGFFHATLTAN